MARWGERVTPAVATPGTVIEQYTKNTRFCLICNYVSKILPALQSRCTRFRFAPLSEEQLLSQVRRVVDSERWLCQSAGVSSGCTMPSHTPRFGRQPGRDRGRPQSPRAPLGWRHAQGAQHPASTKLAIWVGMGGKGGNWPSLLIRNPALPPPGVEHSHGVQYHRSEEHLPLHGHTHAGGY